MIINLPSNDYSKLLLKIARCHLLNCHFAKPSERSTHPCDGTIEYQHYGPNGLEDHQVTADPDAHQLPEPWSGDIEHAPILFIGSNPSISRDEEFPKWSWANTSIEDYFTHRFSGGTKSWINAQMEVLKNDGTYTESSAYWLSLQALAAELLNGLVADIKPGQDYVLTEIVHCKTKKEKFVARASWQTCADRYLASILKLSQASVLVLLGAKARDGMNRQYKLGLSNDIQITKKEIEGLERYAVFLYHPSAHPPYDSKKTFTKAIPSERLEDLRDFLHKAPVLQDRLSK
jgi:hypothetical protein